MSFELSDETKLLISASANLANVTFDRLPSKIKIAVIFFLMAVFKHSVTNMKNGHGLFQAGFALSLFFKKGNIFLALRVLTVM